jgi:hypothetical protein
MRGTSERERRGAGHHPQASSTAWQPSRCRLGRGRLPLQLQAVPRQWLDKPLAEIGADRAAVRERHVRITEKHGAPSADNVFRILRAVYNRGLREHPDLPANPTANVDYHGLRRRKVDANAEKLKAWGRAVVALGSPVRRDLHLFMILPDAALPPEAKPSI